MKTFPRRPLVLLLFITLIIVVPASGRDWEKDPPWLEIPFAPRIVAIGDIHGAFPEFANTLETLGIAKRSSPESFDLTWTGKGSVLLLVGDYCDRGEHSREVYDSIMDLEEEARKVGGQVIPLIGNHEVLLLNGTVEKWAATLKPPKKQHYQNTIDSFTKAGLDFHETISPKGKYGAWIRRRPLFAVINGFLFIHGGLPKPPASKSDLAADFRESVEAENWSKGFLMSETGPLWIRDWWDDETLIQENFRNLGIRGVVFGHTPGALGTEGEIQQKDGKIVSIDIGMTPAYGFSKGGGLLITSDASGKMVFRAKYPDRPEAILFQCPAPINSSIQKFQEKKSQSIR